jgi:two-component system NtrC family response regulator
LARVFLDLFCRKMGRTLRGFSKDAVIALESYAWPGNVRELENKVKRAVIMGEGHQISARDLELEDTEVRAMPLNLRQVRDHAERQAVSRALIYADGNLSQAADMLGIARPTLYSLLSKFDLKA